MTPMDNNLSTLSTWFKLQRQKNLTKKGKGKKTKNLNLKEKNKQQIKKDFSHLPIYIKLKNWTKSNDLRTKQKSLGFFFFFSGIHMLTSKFGVLTKLGINL
eukprot:TRINITY_DN3294_c2_g1_i6.p1 TRINITY_DN3294_c2_g1~~TRINITY_DN3294_c2_g1_i6.p1  ORF type:complete len:101 (-),score=6.69 TRINITY_DN3294_c2_g1_i6:290-592(-)